MQFDYDCDDDVLDEFHGDAVAAAGILMTLLQNVPTTIDNSLNTSDTCSKNVQTELCN